MKKLIVMITIGLFFLSCEKETVQSLPNEGENIQAAKGGTQISASGATQLSGLGYYAVQSECDITGQGANFAIRMTGDLEGCWYGFIDEFDCSPSGTYRESGREYFVGTYKGRAGTFRTTYNFTGKYEGCAANGAAVGAEIFGRCQHPIVEGSGTGVFEDVKGRLDFKDDIQAANFPYRGHFQF
ncbi:MAG TPA: hypothetical protein VLZ28_08165 [Daejeonella sp.]|nr:hypothetical protein [Daejeonella sp.]